MRKTVFLVNYTKLIFASLIVSILSVFLAKTLKTATAYYEDLIFSKVSELPFLFLILPSIGITIIYFLRKYLFKGKQNKGIKEIYATIQNRKNSLPAFKIPSHYVNGFLTVIFGGSTGIEVSTVVATAAIGSTAHKKIGVAQLFKTELICAGVTAGIAILFASPITGLFFALEVIAKKINKSILISCGVAALFSWFFISFIKGTPLFSFTINGWNSYAIPYFILLALIAGFIAVYFTKSVIYIKSFFGKINNNFIRVNVGAVLVGLSILYFPQLFGDSYAAIPELLKQIEIEIFSNSLVFLLLFLIILKPLAASLTLGAGGDGGVFAPGIVTGAFLGMLVAILLNHFFDTHLIVVNFALVGAAAVLSAAINGPLTALFLICSIAPNGFALFVPVLMGSFIAKYAAQILCSYTVYSYNGKLA
ncbi:MAG: chloride channel protein [Pelobium sp.]